MDVGISVPRASTLPCEVVGRPNILHDGRDAVVVIGGNRIVIRRLISGILYVRQLLLPSGKLLFQAVNPCLVGIVLLSQSRSVLYGVIGNLGVLDRSGR